MVHDFKKFPELTNNQLSLYYFQSPHKQITEDFRAKVARVRDGDTIILNWSGRDFLFPLRFSNLAAPELNEEGGKESKSWLEKQILNEDVDIILSKQRVEKWGRLIGRVVHRGLDIGELSIMNGYGLSWENRHDGKIPNFESELSKKLREVENA